MHETNHSRFVLVKLVAMKAWINVNDIEQMKKNKQCIYTFYFVHTFSLLLSTIRCISDTNQSIYWPRFFTVTFNDAASHILRLCLAAIPTFGSSIRHFQKPLYTKCSGLGPLRKRLSSWKHFKRLVLVESSSLLFPVALDLSFCNHWRGRTSQNHRNCHCHNFYFTLLMCLNYFLRLFTCELLDFWHILLNGSQLNPVPYANEITHYHSSLVQARLRFYKSRQLNS
jgi:hypothetical protein